MGFEPTTFCMASRTCAAWPAREIPANRRFRLRAGQPPTPRLYPGDHGGFRTQTGPGSVATGPPGFSRVRREDACPTVHEVAKRRRRSGTCGRSVTNQPPPATSGPRTLPTLPSTKHSTQGGAKEEPEAKSAASVEEQETQAMLLLRVRAGVSPAPAQTPAFKGAAVPRPQAGSGHCSDSCNAVARGRTGPSREWTRCAPTGRRHLRPSRTFTHTSSGRRSTGDTVFVEIHWTGTKRRMARCLRSVGSSSSGIRDDLRDPAWMWG
jgi:hypothetical protein